MLLWNKWLISDDYSNYTLFETLEEKLKELNRGNSIDNNACGKRKANTTNTLP